MVLYSYCVFLRVIVRFYYRISTDSEIKYMVDVFIERSTCDANRTLVIII